jgi:SWI/SNF-related matrix-associated actin-dependent regulator of chromatin subfamily A3
MLRLPRKTERVEVVELAPAERELYDFFKRRSYLLAKDGSTLEPKADSKTGSKTSKQAAGRRRADAAEDVPGAAWRKKAGNIIVLISVLRMICNHGETLLPRVALDAWRSRDAGAVGWALLQTAADSKRSCCICGRVIDGEDEGKREVDLLEFSCKKHAACDGCMIGMEEAVSTCPKCSVSDTKLSMCASPHSISPAYSPSSKISALLRNVLATFTRKDSGDGTNPPTKRYV